ncbi:hypothetical protein MUGA111182_01660 [Mucilaginibacter galii]|uniref:Uncharacterized protein n=1 Tax=Mucilaginibacter galii TaxID=2005073 RepID=A0A917J7G8_9SPHI|nr:hypothetical protein [Mucilaginibacter galii]GGI48836.1 hypothetical protein GCM10011425_00480 [Mucilaginibacter galii]
MAANTFIELTDKNGRPALINVNNITSVVVYTDPEMVHVYVIGDNQSFVTVKETYDEVKAKIASVSGGSIW